MLTADELAAAVGTEAAKELTEGMLVLGIGLQVVSAVHGHRARRRRCPR
jgi:hypothetical protein